MTEKFLSTITDMNQSISFDPSALLTTSTINNLHFPDLTTSGISDSGGGRPTSFILDGVGMCESMTESFCSVAGQDDSVLVNSTNGLHTDTSLRSLEKKNFVNAQKKRRSRKAQYDASVDGISLDKIETVNIIDEHNEADDAWLFQIPTNGNRNNSTSENIFSWVHKEFKENDINATKHRLLCKLDDMSHARTIRSISCHNFAGNQRSDSVKRSSTEQQVNPESVGNGRMISPLRSGTPLMNGNGNTRPTSPVSSSPLRHTIAATSASIRSRDASREREREPLDYTDLEVMAKVQLEKLRLAERQGPLSKRFGGSNASLASTNSATSITLTNQPGNKPPVAPKSLTARNGVKPNNHRRSNTQTISTNASNNYDLPDASDTKATTPGTNRTGAAPNSANTTNRTRPPVSRPLQSYRGSQTSYNNNLKTQSTPPTPPATVQKNVKKPTNDLGSTFTAKQFSSTENNLLNDVSNKPRTQITPSRRPVTQSFAEQIPPTSSSSVDVTHTATIPTNGQTSIPRSSSTLSQGRKSGIPTIGKPGRPSIPTPTRYVGVFRTPCFCFVLFCLLCLLCKLMDGCFQPSFSFISPDNNQWILNRPTTSYAIPSSQSSDSMMTTRNIRASAAVTRPQIPDTVSPTSSWNEGCY